MEVDDGKETLFFPVQSLARDPRCRGGGFRKSQEDGQEGEEQVARPECGAKDVQVVTSSSLGIMS